MLAYARCSFAGESNLSAEYLNIVKGEPLVIDKQSIQEGWILAAKAESNYWKTGWIPATYWSEEPPVDDREQSLEDLFCEEILD